MSSLARYDNHGIYVEGNTVRTPLGATRITLGQTTLLLGLLEAYPRSVTEATLIDFYEFFRSNYNPDSDAMALGIIPVQISHMRKNLLSVGLVIGNVWGKGWFIKLDFEVPRVSIPA